MDKIVEEAVQLPDDAVAELIERIVAGRHGGIHPEVEEAWREEARLRVAEINSKKAEGVPVQEALSRAARVLDP